MNLRNLVHIILEKNWTLLILESMHMKIDEKIVIDTNILIYFFNADSEFHSFARSIITDNRDTIFITHKSITEFVGVL